MKKVMLCLLLAVCLPVCGLADGVYVKDVQYEYAVGAEAWQLSAEAQAMMLQSFAAAKGRVAELLLYCLDDGNTAWTLTTDERGDKQMLHNGVPVAVIADIDDTLVDGAHYTADIVGNGGENNNVAFARFVLSDGCSALPGAVSFVNACRDAGIEVFYITNRYDLGYRVNQIDAYGSYWESCGSGGQYKAADGTEIGTTIYQVLGKSFFDITLESMTKLGFPIDDQHLIVNDSKLNGSSKEAARQAVICGAQAYPNGQRADGNCTSSALTLQCAPHEVVLLLGDNLGDFTDAFADASLTAVTRAALAESFQDKWGREWIVLPNAVYGSFLSAALSYGIPELFDAYSYNK